MGSVKFESVIIAKTCNDDVEFTADVQNQDNVEDFASLMVKQPVVEGLTRCGFNKPSPIQVKAIPLGLLGLDLVVQAKSGTGKTCVFTVMTLDTVVIGNTVPQVLIVAHTREIAVQIEQCIRNIGKAMKGLRVCLCIGGMQYHSNVTALKRGVHIVVGTPGRLCQLVKDSNLSLETVRLLVLDEADKMMEQCYVQSINWLFSQLAHTKQVAVFSATYPRSLDAMLSEYMTSPTMVKLDSGNVQLVGIKQFLYLIADVTQGDKANKYSQVYDFKRAKLIHLLSCISYNQALIFCGSHDIAHKLDVDLSESGLESELMSGTLEQKQRNEVMERLKKCKNRLLVTTDLTSRGIDAHNVDLVICFETPNDPETYFHRIGRAGRFGGYGAAITLAVENLDAKRFMAIGSNATGAGDKGFNVKYLPEDLSLVANDICSNQKFWDEQNEVIFRVRERAIVEKKTRANRADSNRLTPLEFLEKYKMLDVVEYEGNEDRVYSRQMFMQCNPNKDIVNSVDSIANSQEYKLDPRSVSQPVIKSVFDPIDVFDPFDASKEVEEIFCPQKTSKEKLVKLIAPELNEKVVEKTHANTIKSEALCASSSSESTCSDSGSDSTPCSPCISPQIFYAKTSPQKTQEDSSRENSTEAMDTAENLMIYSREDFIKEKGRFYPAPQVPLRVQFLFAKKGGNSWYHRMIGTECPMLSEIQQIECESSGQNVVQDSYLHSEQQTNKTKAKGNVYPRRSMLKICNSQTQTQWEQYCAHNYDVTEEPFVTDRAMRGNFAKQIIIINQRKKEKLVESEVKKFMRVVEAAKIIDERPAPDSKWLQFMTAKDKIEVECDMLVSPRPCEEHWEHMIGEDTNRMKQLAEIVKSELPQRHQRLIEICYRAGKSAMPGCFEAFKDEIVTKEVHEFALSQPSELASMQMSEIETPSKQSPKYECSSWISRKIAPKICAPVPGPSKQPNNKYPKDNPLCAYNPVKARIISYDRETLLHVYSQVITFTSNIPISKWLTVHNRLKQLNIFVDRQGAHEVEQEMSEGQEEIEVDEKTKADVMNSDWADKCADYERNMWIHYEGLRQWHKECATAIKHEQRWHMFNKYMQFMRSEQ